MEIHPEEGVQKEEFPHSRKPSHRQVRGELWNLRWQHNQEGKKKKMQNRCLTATASGEVCQTLASPTSKQRLNMEVWAA